MNRSCVPSGARWMHNGVLFELSLSQQVRPKSLRTATSGHGEVHLVGGDGEIAADVVAVCKHLRTCTSIFGP